MPRVLAIDYGEKRTGIAVTDANQKIAFPLTTVPTKEVLPYLKKYMTIETVERFIVGEPKHLDNTPAQFASKVNDFINELKKFFPLIPIERIDERFTSTMAFQTMIDAGLKKKHRRNKALIDTISAVLILQSWLEKKRNEAILKDKS